MPSFFNIINNKKKGMIILIDIEIPEDLYDGKKISCIYCVTNKLNNRKYIGQTTNYRKRISAYRSLNIDKLGRMKIYDEIISVGKNNFSINIIKRCEPRNLTVLEDYYIKKYNSYNPLFGYNIRRKNKGTNTLIRRNNLSKSHIGLKHNNTTKKSKSNTILAFKDNKCIVCDGGKLFGDFISVSKDLIKNGLRQPSKIKGYRLYYNDYIKRQDIRLKMMRKRCIRDKEYIELLDLLDNIETEGVETIYSYWDIYRLEYGDDTPYKLTQLSCVLNNTGKV